MDESEKKLFIRFCQADGVKSSTLNIMHLLLRFQDYFTQKKEDPDGRTIISWVLNQLNNEISQAASFSQSKNLIEAQNLIAKVIQDFDRAAIPNFQELINDLRNAVTKITSEAAHVANELKF
ncbi:MAG: hypothetical protein ACTSYB_01785 [Candidatus Helarchaeota archaeon]